MSEENEALAHRFHIDIFQKGDLEAADEILAPDFIWRNPSLPSDNDSCYLSRRKSNANSYRLLLTYLNYVELPNASTMAVSVAVSVLLRC